MAKQERSDIRFCPTCRRGSAILSNPDDGDLRRLSTTSTGPASPERLLVYPRRNRGDCRGWWGYVGKGGKDICVLRIRETMRHVSSPRSGRRWPEGPDEGASVQYFSTLAPSSPRFAPALLPGGEKKLGAAFCPGSLDQSLGLNPGTKPPCVCTGETALPYAQRQKGFHSTGAARWIPVTVTGVREVAECSTSASAYR